MTTSSSASDSPFSQIGRYGTLSLLRPGSSAVVTAFGIDNEELTFGRDPTCDVRLYYNDVDLVHCKIVFEERKAFIVVLGEAGILVDGCHVRPTDNPSRNDPTTVPLSNDSEIEIRTKRFRFTYPPKELRAVLIASPRRTTRALRLSMIHAAQVFSPRPSADPRENLRILQTPLKNTFMSPSKRTPANPSPLRSRYNAFQSQASPTPGAGNADDDDDEDEDEEEEEEEQIVLVETNHPRVVQEDKDLVILEDVRISPQKQQQQLWLQRQHQQPFGSPVPRTPQRPKAQSLHRAVLIRSVQRAVMKAERDREEEEEEMEVLGAVVDEDEDEDEVSEEEEKEEDAPGDDAGRQEYQDEEVEEEQVSEDEDSSDEERPEPPAERKSMWRKSLESIWPFKALSPAPAVEESESDSDEDDEDEVPATEIPQDENERPVEDESDEEATEPMNEDGDEENQEAPAPAPATTTPDPLPDPQPQASTPVPRRPLGSFMTPQHNPQHAPSRAQLTTTTAGPRRILGPSTLATVQPSNQGTDSPKRMSMGGEPRRVPIESQRWKVKDLLIPLNDGSENGGVKQEKVDGFVKPESPTKLDSILSPVRQSQSQSSSSGSGSAAGVGAGAIATPARGRGRQALSEAERRAIQERRRSAVKEADPFWGGGVPGLSSPIRNSSSIVSTSTPGSTSSSGGGLFASFLAAVSASGSTSTVSTSTSTTSGPPSSASRSMFPPVLPPPLASPSPTKMRARSMSPRKVSNPLAHDPIKEEEDNMNTSTDLHTTTTGTPAVNISSFSSAYINQYSTSCTPEPVSGVSDTPMRVKDEDEDGMDTRSLLQKMKQTVEGMKRRRSSVVPPSLLATTGGVEDVRKAQNDADVVIGDEVQATAKAGPRMSIMPAPAEKKDDNMEVDVPAAPPTTVSAEAGKERSEQQESESDSEFSLLRPSVKAELRRISLGGGLLQSLQPQGNTQPGPTSSTPNDDINMEAPEPEAPISTPRKESQSQGAEMVEPPPPEGESSSIVIPLPTDLPPDEDPEEDEVEEPVPVERPTRRLKTPRALRKTREVESAAPPIKHTPGRRGRKPAVAEPEAQEDEQELESAPTPAKRGRKPAVDVPPNTAPTRRVARSATIPTPAAGPSSLPAPRVRRTKTVEEPQASKKLVVRRGVKRGGAEADETPATTKPGRKQAGPSAGDGVQDEAVPITAAKKGVRRVVAPVEPEPSTEVKKGRSVKTPAAATIGTASRLKRPTTRPRAAEEAKVKVEKEEDGDMDLSDPLDIIGKDGGQPATDKKGKARTIPASTTTRETRTKAVKQEEASEPAGATRARTARSIPRSAPAKVGEKENVSEEEEGVATKTIRVSRSRKAGASGDAGDDAPVTRSAPARVTRKAKTEEEPKTSRTATTTRTRRA